MPRELAACVERANLDPEVHVIALAGNGSGLLRWIRPGGERRGEHAGSRQRRGAPAGSPIDPMVQARNHDQSGTWDPVTDYQMMSRNLRGFMSLFHSEKPTICKIHGYCVAGGTDMALCSDLIVVEDRAKIGYPPARVWGVPTSALWAYRVGPARAKRLLLTGDSIDGTTAAEWGLASEVAPAAQLDDRFEALLRAGRAGSDQPAGHAQAPCQPGALRAGPAGDPGAGRLLRRNRPAHARGVRLAAPRRREGVQGGRPRAGRALRRLRPPSRVARP